MIRVEQKSENKKDAMRVLFDLEKRYAKNTAIKRDKRPKRHTFLMDTPLKTRKQMEKMDKMDSALETPQLNGINAINGVRTQISLTPYTTKSRCKHSQNTPQINGKTSKPV